MNARDKKIYQENERLYSHHSSCKREMGDLVDLANKWRIRCWVLEKEIGWMNTVYSWWDPDDLKKETDLHATRLFEKYKRTGSVKKALEADEILWKKYFDAHRRGGRR